MSFISVDCPHCGGSVIIESINCGIFRHGINKISGVQINPHLSKDEIDLLILNNIIWGCGGPFRIIRLESSYVAFKCDYI